MHMLDTNICIYVLKHHSDRLRHRFKVTPDLAMSAITYAELCFGIENGDPSARRERWRQLELFTRRLLVLPVAQSVGPIYGRIRAELRRRGRMIGNNDLFIAAHALTEDAVLVSNNQKEFQRVPGLRVENWV
jgi:tRNA(fMet)-specific endonuclease VapC